MKLIQSDGIFQMNDAIVGDDTAQSNFVGVNQDLQLSNLCDETGVEDNFSICGNEWHQLYWTNKPI